MADDDDIRKELHDEIKMVLELTARVDERLKVMIEKQTETTSRLNTFIDSHNALASRVVMLEAFQNNNSLIDLKEKYESVIERLAKLEADPVRVERMDNTLTEVRKIVCELKDRVGKIEDTHDGVWSRGRFIVDLLVKAGFTILVCWMLYRLGLTTPPIP